jgi:hypothetical protein
VYNKVFSKILDSSIWLESDQTRLVWLTLLAAMDQDGFAHFASVANLAHRARVTVEATVDAVHVLENMDPNSADPDHGGRRIERVPGGWLVLNAQKYKTLATREDQRQQTRERMARHRKTKGVTASDADVTVGDAPLRSVTPRDENVTLSETETEADKNPPTPLKRGAVTRAERKHAEELRRRAFGCTHDPRCQTAEACIVTIVMGLREQATA